jgi:integrase
MRESNPSEPATMSLLLSGFQHKEGENTRLWNKIDQNWTRGHCIYAMKAPMTMDRYKTRLAKFLDFIEVEVEDGSRSLEDKARTFAKKSKTDFNWAFANQFQKGRVDKKEITGATVRNYVKSIKLFCEISDIPIPWKKITRGLPKGKKYADDRIPTIEEIRKVVEYPDRRIKAIVYTMASSGIRSGYTFDL